MADLSFAKYLGSLTEDEFSELLSSMEIEKSRREQPEDSKGLTVKEEKIIAYPHCGSATIKKHGKRNGKQKYNCKDCGKMFTETSNCLSRLVWVL